MLQRLLIEKIEHRILVGTLAFLGILVLVGWIAINEGGRMQAFESQYLGRSVERGAGLFNANCSTCHGLDGRGIVGRGPGLNSPYLFGHNFLADLDREQVALDRERVNATPERQAEIDARLTEMATERAARITQMDKAINQTGGDYDPESPSRLSNLGWGGSLRSFVYTTLVHGRPNSGQYWPQAMVAWGQTAGGPLRPDQLDDLTNYILNWDKGSAWTVEDLNAVNQFPVTVADASLVSADPNRVVINPDGLTAEELDLTAIDAELANFQGDPTNGQSLYNGALACAGCHMNAAVAPLTEGTWTRTNEVRLADPANAGLTAEQYLSHAIIHPNQYTAPGYPSGVMPSNFSTRLTYQELADLLAFLRSQDQPAQ